MPTPTAPRTCTRRASAASCGATSAGSCRAAFTPDLARVRDLQRFPELRWLDRFDILVPAALAVALFAAGAALERHAPGLGTNRWQMLVWGFFVSTVLCYHATFTINSLAHVFGRRRYATGDDSRNNALLALLTFGEGWHNNHHHYPNAARQGFYWWEVDLTYYLLRALAAVGVTGTSSPCRSRSATTTAGAGCDLPDRRHRARPRAAADGRRHRQRHRGAHRRGRTAPAPPDHGLRGRRLDRRPHPHGGRGRTRDDADDEEDGRDAQKTERNHKPLPAISPTESCGRNDDIGSGQITNRAITTSVAPCPTSLRTTGAPDTSCKLCTTCRYACPAGEP